MKRITTLLFVFTFISSVAWGTKSSHFDRYAKQVQFLLQNTQQVNTPKRFHLLLEQTWQYWMEDQPEWATYAGYPGFNHLWTDLSQDAINNRRAMNELTLSAIKKVQKNKLSQKDQLNYDLFYKLVEAKVAQDQFPHEYLQLTQLDGVHQDPAQTISIMPKNNLVAYQDILSRLQKIPHLADQVIALLKEGIKQNITTPKIVLRNVPQQIQNQIFDDPMKSPLLKPFQDFPSTFSKEQKEKLKTQAIAIYNHDIKPKYKELHDFFQNKYLPAARESIAISALPNGKRWYAERVRYHTTTNLSPKDIHEIGLREVKRIRTEMEKIKADVGFKGSLHEFFKYLRTSPQFFFTAKENLLKTYRDIAKRADPELVKLFGLLPRLPYGIKKIPSYAEKSQTTAYYMQGSLESGRPGIFYANTYDLKSRPKWEMEALTLHEAVPGHHLQISIAKELENIPEFRKEADFTAFIEGWGLYSESLGEEMGFYKNSYSKFGQLTYEMWRAIRLVVDTGMHALGWSREQAIEFFKNNAGKSEHDITVEVDRYIVWPGQALAYKMGELKIKELRNLATQKLKDAFDIREFHDVVLGEGALPLDLLESRVRHWIQEKNHATKKWWEMASSKITSRRNKTPSNS